jgi:hypothetical protein
VQHTSRPPFRKLVVAYLFAGQVRHPPRALRLLHRSFIISRQLLYQVVVQSRSVSRILSQPATRRPMMDTFPFLWRSQPKCFMAFDTRMAFAAFAVPREFSTYAPAGL